MTAAHRNVMHFIGGDEVQSTSGRTFPTLNPATGEQIGAAAFGEPGDVDRAVEAAWQAFAYWRDAPVAERAACLRRVALLIRERAEEIARLEAIDAGKPIVDARGEVETAACLLEYAATLPQNVRGHVYPQTPGYFEISFIVDVQ